MAPLLNGMLCQVLLYTSTVYSTLNLITVQFSTPSFTPLDSMLFCFNDTSFIVDNTNFSVTTLIAGGDIWTPGDPLVEGGWQDTAFFNYNSNPDLDAVQTGTVYEVLGSDAYYAGSYAQQR